MVVALRNRLPDEAVEFLDSSVALTAGDIFFPPLLGTGGNIGRLDLVTNYLEHLTRVLGLVPPSKGDARPGEWFDEPINGIPVARVEGAPGQFDPLGTGGPNQARVMKPRP
jgi:CRISPR-associated protein Csx17